MDLKLLREATRPEHEATEAVVPLMAPDLTRAAYGAVLQRFGTVVRAWDSFAAAAAPAHLEALVQQRQRSQAIAEDLRFLGLPAETGEPRTDLQGQMYRLTERDGGTDASRFLGAMYVVEGSTLGGRYIAAHAERVLGLEPDQGDRYFRGYGDRTMPMWREFQQALLAVPDADSGDVIDAAKEMFGIFQQVLGTGHLANIEQALPESRTRSAELAS